MGLCCGRAGRIGEGERWGDALLCGKDFFFATRLRHGFEESRDLRGEPWRHDEHRGDSVTLNQLSKAVAPKTLSGMKISTSQNICICFYSINSLFLIPFLMLCSFIMDICISLSALPTQSVGICINTPPCTVCEPVQYALDRVLLTTAHLARFFTVGFNLNPSEIAPIEPIMNSYRSTCFLTPFLNGKISFKAQVRFAMSSAGDS